MKINDILPESENCKHGRYYCSTDKKWKCRQGPKQSRTNEAANPAQQAAIAIAKKKKQGVAENFADGKVKGKSRPGRVKAAGASCDGSVTDLRAKAKKYGGEKGKMYHWCANMKAGKK